MPDRIAPSYRRAAGGGPGTRPGRRGFRCRLRVAGSCRSADRALSRPHARRNSPGCCGMDRATRPVASRSTPRSGTPPASRRDSDRRRCGGRRRTASSSGGCSPDHGRDLGGLAALVAPSVQGWCRFRVYCPGTGLTRRIRRSRSDVSAGHGGRRVHTGASPRRPRRRDPRAGLPPGEHRPPDRSRSDRHPLRSARRHAGRPARCRRGSCVACPRTSAGVAADPRRRHFCRSLPRCEQEPAAPGRRSCVRRPGNLRRRGPGGVPAAPVPSPMAERLRLDLGRDAVCSSRCSGGIAWRPSGDRRCRRPWTRTGMRAEHPSRPRSPCSPARSS